MESDNKIKWHDMNGTFNLNIIRFIYECVIEQCKALPIQTDLICILENRDARVTFMESTYSLFKSEIDEKEERIQFDV